MTTRTGEPGWVQDAIWWHVYPLGFVGAGTRAETDRPVAHRLGHLAGWLDHAFELGASGLVLGPVFASESHGYDTTDHLRVDPRLGDGADLGALLAACRARGLRVVLDGVFNHVGRGHPAFRAVLEQGTAAATASWFRLRWPGGEQAWRPGIEPAYDDFEGHAHPGRPEPPLAGRRRPRRGGHDPLARPRRRRMAPGCGVRRADLLLGGGGRPRARPSPRRVPDG
jgi:cyclomaltodextrinase